MVNSSCIDFGGRGTLDTPTTHTIWFCIKYEWLDIKIRVPDCQLAHIKVSAIIFVNTSGVKSDIYDCLVFLIDRFDYMHAKYEIINPQAEAYFG